MIPNDETATPGRQTVLEMRAVSKRFAGVQALDRVNLTAYPGEVLALIGENGAGKLTLVKILAGVHTPDSGEIRIGGEAVHFRRVRDASERGIAFIHQELNVLDNLDVAANMFLGREPTIGGPLKLVDRARMRRDAAPYLARLGVDIDPATTMARLSIASQQLVEIAKALTLDARVLIMDEPTSSLTLAETDRLLTVVRELVANGVAVIYISHRMGEISQIADRVTALRDGRNSGELAGDEITHEAMIRSMVGRDLAKDVRGGDMEPGAAVLTVKGLTTRRYAGRAVSFEVRAGEIVGMAGLVGAGRSELAQALFGIDPPLAGTIELGGRRIRIRTPRDAIRRGIYLCPEDRKRSGVVLEMSVKHNVTLPSLGRYAYAWLVRANAEAAAAGEAVRKLRVKTPDIDFPVKNLSGGNQQKVVLAKWLSLSPKLLIFDEPTRGIDVGSKAEIYGLMRDLAREGVAILMISSDMEEVLNLSDRIVVMHEGRISGQLDRAVASEHSVMQLAVGAAVS